MSPPLGSKKEKKRIVTITLHVTEEFKSRVTEYAKEDGMSRSSFAMQGLEQYMSVIDLEKGYTLKGESLPKITTPKTVDIWGPVIKNETKEKTG